MEQSDRPNLQPTASMTFYNQITPGSEHLLSSEQFPSTEHPSASGFTEDTLISDSHTSDSHTPDAHATAPSPATPSPAAPSLTDSLTGDNLTANNLTIVRQGLTSKPQNSYADFKIRATSYGLEIEFSQQRLRSSPIFTQKQDSTEEPGLSLLMVAMTILLVGGSVALTKSIVFGILVAIAIPVFWNLATPSPAPAPNRTAKLRFVNTPKNQTFLSLTTAPSSPQTTPHRAQIQHLTPAPDKADTIHFSNLPVQLVSASTYFIGGQLSLTLYTSDPHGKNRLRITGTRQEIRWLHSRIAKWGKETLPHPIA